MFFTLILYKIFLFLIQRDASQYFTINNTIGYLYQIRQFDFEDTEIQCGLGRGGGFLNITAEVTLHTHTHTYTHPPTQFCAYYLIKFMKHVTTYTYLFKVIDSE